MDTTDLLTGQKDTSLSNNVERLEVISGPTGRRRWAPEVKARIVLETLRGDASVSRVAARHGVRANQVFQWRRQAREGKLALPSAATSEIAFAPVVLEADTRKPAPAPHDTIDIVHQDVVVRVGDQTAAARIGAIALALRIAR